MRQRRVYLILLVVGVVLAGVLAVVFRREREPDYGGKKLSEWLEGYGNPSGSTFETDYMIRQIGTNAIPYLLKWMRYETAPWKVRLNRIVRQFVTKVFVGARPFWERHDQESFFRAEHATMALMKLRSPSPCEIRELEKMLLNPKGAKNAVRRAANVLSWFGQLRMQQVLTVVTNHPPRWALPYLDLALSRMRNDAQPAIPVLQQILTDPDPEVRRFATNNLKVLEWHPPGPPK